MLPPRNAVGLWQIWPRIKSVARAPSFVRVLKHQLHSLLGVADFRRQNLFNAWLGGLFMVAPFVDVLMQFVVPLLVTALVEIQLA